MPPLAYLPNLRAAHLRVQYCLRDPLTHPAYQGSLWRGAFGHALKEFSDPLALHCPACELYDSCTYPPLFESRVPAALGAGSSDDAAGPLVLRPPLAAPGPLPVGSLLELGLVLMGSALRNLPLLVRVLAHLGERGLGERRAQATLTRVQAHWPGGCVQVRVHGGARNVRSQSSDHHQPDTTTFPLRRAEVDVRDRSTDAHERVPTHAGEGR